MSTPTRELESLCIGRSMVTNAQRSQRERRARDRARQLKALETIMGHTGRIYNIQQLGDSVNLAKEGLCSEEFLVDHSMRVTSDGSTYYGFQIKQPVSVRIYDSAKAEKRVECTCEPFQKGRVSVCVHIYWLFDGLNRCLSEPFETTVQIITNEEVLNRLTDFFDQIGDRLDPRTNRLDSLTKELNIVRDKDSDAESDDDLSETYSDTGEQDQSEWIIQDMLSVFDDKYLPTGSDHERQVPVIPVQITSLQDLIDSEDLGATLYGLIRHDKLLHRRLRKVLNKEVCAEHFLEKIDGRIQTILARFNEQYNQWQMSRVRLVHECAERLRACIRLIREYINERVPFRNEAVKTRAAEIAVDLLVKISQSPDPATRALSTNLIDISDDQNEEDFFVLGFLGELPPDEWSQHLQRLEEVCQQLKRDGAPQVYVERLEEIMQAYENHQDTPIKSVGERPPISGESAARRRRIE